jgi:MFS family permease
MQSSAISHGELDIDQAKRQSAQRGWRVVAAAFCVMFAIFGATYSFSAFFAHLQETFAASRGSISQIFSIVLFLYHILGAVSGPIADRVGPRSMVLSGIAAVGAGFICASLATALWQVYLSFGLVGIGVGFAYVPSIATVQRWFVRQRGFASGLAVSGIGFGTLCVPLAAAQLIVWFDWRGALVALGLFAIAVGGVASMFVDGSPERHGMLPDGGVADLASAEATKPAEGVSLGEAVRSPIFWLLYVALFLVAVGQFIPFVHLVPYAEDHGISHGAAVVIFSMIGIGSTFGRLALGRVADHYGRRRSLASMYLGMMLILLWWLGATVTWQLIGYLPGRIFLLCMGLFSIFWFGAASAGPLVGRDAVRPARDHPGVGRPSLEMGIRRHHVGGKADAFQEADGQPGVVDLPPAMAVPRRARIGVVVIVPAFAVGDQPDDEVVAAVLVGLVVPISPHMGHRVDRPRDVPDQDRAYEYAEHQNAQSRHGRRCRRFSRQPGDGEACTEEHRHLQEIDPDQPIMAFERDVEPVAQNVPGIAFVDSQPRELRLMDQDPADVAPEEAGQRRVRVRLFVGELMMAAVNGDPARRRFLQAGHRDDDHGVLEPFGTFQAAMGEKSVIAKVDAEQPAQMGADDRHDEAAPGEIAGHERKHRHGVICTDADDVRPVQLERLHARRQRYPDAVKRRERGVGREYGGSCGRPWSGRHAEIGSISVRVLAGAVRGRFLLYESRSLHRAHKSEAI